MNYTERTTNGIIGTSIKVKLYDIVQPLKGYWKNKMAIVTAIKSETKHVHIRIIENGLDMMLRIKDVAFVNHNTKSAAKSYFDLCEKMKAKFIAKYTDIEYIKEHFDTDPIIINDITAKTITDGAGIFITDNVDKYSAKAVNWLAEHKELISSIIRIPDINIIQQINDVKHGTNDYEYNNIIKLYNLFNGKD